MELDELISIPIPLRPSLSRNPKAILHKLSCSLVFFLISVSIHSIQILSLFLLIIPFNYFNTIIYNKVIRYSKEAFSGLLTVLIVGFGKSKYKIYADTQEELDALVKKDENGKVVGFRFDNNSVFISNHQQYADWIYCWILMHFARISSGLVIVLKASLRWVPIIGPAMQFFRFIFINKVKLLQNAGIVKQLQDNVKSASPFALLLFPEATLISKFTRPKSEAFAEASGIPDMTNTLLPRSTGLLYCLRSLSAVSPDLALYNLTIGYPGVPFKGYAQDYYTLASTFGLGQAPPVVHIYIQSIKIETVPIGLVKTGSTDKELESTLVNDERERFQEWMIGKWREKDELMGGFYETGRFKSGAQVEFEIKLLRHDYLRLLSVPLILFSLYSLYQLFA